MVYYYGKSFASGKKLSKPYKSIVECRKAALKSLSASHYDTFFIYNESEIQIGEVKDYGFVGHAEYELHNHWGPPVWWVLNRDGTLGKRMGIDERIKSINRNIKTRGL